MSRYNCMKSIPIDSLSSRQLKKAFVQWSEGNPVLEQLLIMFYKNGIKTNGCHWGPGSYVSIDYDSNKKEDISKLMDIALNIEDTQVLMMPDGGNPFSGPDFYKTTVSFDIFSDNLEVSTKFFLELLATLQNQIELKQLDVKPVLELLEFLTGKYIDLDLRVLHSNEDGYVFELDGYIHSEQKTAYLCNLLSPLDLEFIQDDNSSYKCWDYKSNNPVDFSEKLKEISKHIIENYSLKAPTENDEYISLNILANLKRKKSIEQTGNLIQFERWLKEERKRMNKLQKQKVLSKTL